MAPLWIWLPIINLTRRESLKVYAVCSKICILHNNSAGQLLYAEKNLHQLLDVTYLMFRGITPYRNTREVRFLIILDTCECELYNVISLFLLVLPLSI